MSNSKTTKKPKTAPIKVVNTGARHPKGVKRPDLWPDQFEPVVWFPEMDAMLRTLHATHTYRWLQKEGAKLIGVSDKVLRKRLKVLGLSKPKTFPPWSCQFKPKVKKRAA